ncbi:MAG: AI-2E family transporter [Chthoniobacterales bacterium]
MSNLQHPPATPPAGLRPRVGKKYPTAWQRKTMWAALSAIFVVVLILIVSSIVWIAGQLIRFLQPILIPVAIAAIMAYLLDPVVTHLSKRRMSRGKAVILIFGVVFLALVALASWVVPTVSLQSANFARDLPSYTVRAREKIVDLLSRYHQSIVPAPGAKNKTPGLATTVANWLLAAPAHTPRPASETNSPSPSPPVSSSSPREPIGPASPKLSSAERQRVQDWVERQLPNLQSQLPNLADKFWLVLTTSIGGFLGITGFLLSLVMVPIYLFFLLKERPAIERRWHEYLPLRNSPLKDEVVTALTQINHYLIAYFRGQLLVCLIDGLLIGAGLLALGLNFAPLIGILVVILTMIPYVGIFLCWIPAVLIAAAQWGDWTHVLLVTAIFVIIQNLEAIFLAPRIVGNSVGLHPMTVIVSIFVWGLLIGGLLGPILAVPLTATIKVLLSRYVWGQRLHDQVEKSVAEVPIGRSA